MVFTVGNGNHMQAEGRVQDIQLQVQGHTFNVPVYLLPISGADLILGGAWLATIGLHLADYQSLQIKFYHQGKFVTLRGDATLKPAEA